MTDDLVARLREEAECYQGKTQSCLTDAADRIEQLTNERDKAARLGKSGGYKATPEHSWAEWCDELYRDLNKANERIKQLETALRGAYENCLNAVEKVKSDLFTQLGVHHKSKLGDITAKDWMVAFAEDVEREINARAALEGKD